MSRDTAYKLGNLSAVNDFTAWLQNDDGNPTTYPKRRGSILKTAQGNPMTPNPSTMPNAAQPLPSGGLGGAIGKPAPGMGGGAPIAPPPGGGGGGRVSTAAALPPTPPPPPPPGRPVTGGKTQNAREIEQYMPKMSAERAVEQVMRKFGKSMSRRPLSRDGTKYEAIKKKLRKQKPKKS